MQSNSPTSSSATKSSTTSSGSVKPPPKKEPTLLSYKQPAVQSTVSAVISADEMMANYVSTLNQTNVDAEQHPNIYAYQECILLRPLFSRLLSIPATSTAV